MSNAGNTTWQKKGHYNERSFLYKGQEISTYYKSIENIGLRADHPNHWQLLDYPGEPIDRDL